MATSLLREDLADELALFLALKLLGEPGQPWLGELGVRRMAEAWALEPVQLARAGEDLLVRARMGEKKRRRS
jgi:diaminohydroxyphosphoribosylaminopyrimidine deaminase/5-amino-6-(5-phosphoribosylamino)uracil reductase